MLTRRKPLQSKSLFKQGKPLRSKRGRKRSASAQRYLDYVTANGCLVCGGPATVHHVTAPITGGRITRSEQLLVPLCPVHHQIVYDPKASDPQSVEALGHAGFHRVHGIDLLAEAERLWRERP